ncbi:mechanosensitive ion channel family protein [Candidatus Saccharibacteria bacterium]|nr:mechanosensitive ion channel family protein [Candidatus Saccharibacteria bacterium]
MEDFIKNISWDNIVSSIVTVIIAIILFQIIKKTFKRVFDRNKNKERNTYFAMVGSFIRIIYITLVALLVLRINGVNVDGLLAGVGIASVAIGLAVQDTLKDIIRGISIISEDYFKMGDYVTIGTDSGTVVYSGIRSTKLKDGLTGNIISIANRNIEKAEVSATTLNINIPLPYELKLSDAETIMHEIAEASKTVEFVTDCEYRGVNSLAESAIEYRLFAKSEKGKRIEAKRNILHKTLEVLEKHKVSVPYPQMDVHRKV